MKKRLWAITSPAIRFEITLESWRSFRKFSALDITEEISGQEVSVGGMITGLRQLRTRKGDSMAAFELEDLSGTVQVLVWPNAYKRNSQLMENDVPVLVRGRCELDAKGEIRLLCSQLFHLDTLWNTVVQKDEKFESHFPLWIPRKFPSFMRW